MATLEAAVLQSLQLLMGVLHLQQNKQTEQMECELALIQESIAHTQQQQDSLQNALAQKEECLEHKKQDTAKLQSVISQLSLDKQQQEKYAQV